MISPKEQHERLPHSCLMALCFDWQEEPITSLGKELLLYPCGQQDKLPDYLELFQWQLSSRSASNFQLVSPLDRHLWDGHLCVMPKSLCDRANSEQRLRSSLKPLFCINAGFSLRGCYLSLILILKGKGGRYPHLQHPNMKDRTLKDMTMMMYIR